MRLVLCRTSIDRYRNTSRVGAPVIAYYNATSGDLKVASKSKGVWTLSATDTYKVVGAWASLAADSLGHLHVAYQDVTASDLKHATFVAADPGCL